MNFHLFLIQQTLKGTVVNRTCHCINGQSLKLTSTIPLNGVICIPLLLKSHFIIYSAGILVKIIDGDISDIAQCHQVRQCTPRVQSRASCTCTVIYIKRWVKGIVMYIVQVQSCTLYSHLEGNSCTGKFINRYSVQILSFKVKIMYRYSQVQVFLCTFIYR